MANDLNRCDFIGRLGKDPESASTNNGMAVTKISIAVGESWKDKQTGQKQERPTWVPVVAFGALAEIMEKYLKKGSQVYISGKFTVRKWQDKDGQDRYTTEIVVNVGGTMQMLGGRQGGGAAPGGNMGGGQQQGSWGQPQQPQGNAFSGGAQSRPQQAPAAPAPSNEPPMDFDDDIPF